MKIQITLECRIYSYIKKESVPAAKVRTLFLLWHLIKKQQFHTDGEIKVSSIKDVPLGNETKTWNIENGVSTETPMENLLFLKE
ncbi:hypothetical protein [Bacillus inaquosorum]|uniref:hypothetical protein n=1 Tax=Bacillus inaquosorum TaxID=483913 RepID=UPI00227FC1E5|nr:hypothetical protein [Bacillus inaquosorum]MCY8177435.1 hypothetical protein [Bacillus inaquosorum]